MAMVHTRRRGDLPASLLTMLGGSWVVISGVISPLIWVITIVTLLLTPLITTHEPLSAIRAALASIVHQNGETFFHHPPIRGFPKIGGPSIVPQIVGSLL